MSLVAGAMAIGVLVTSGVLFERVGRAAPFVLVACGTGLLAGLGVVGVREPPRRRARGTPRGFGPRCATCSPPARALGAGCWWPSS